MKTKIDGIVPGMSTIRDPDSEMSPIRPAPPEAATSEIRNERRT